MAAACEIDPLCRSVIHLRRTGSARPKKMFWDISRRRPRELPDHDFYVACCPCQPFSTMGARQGVRDARGRRLSITHIISVLAAKHPWAFLLKNVKGLATQRRATFENILQQLRQTAGSAYKVGLNPRRGRLWHPTASRARLHRGFAPGCQGSWNLIRVAHPEAA